METGKVIFTETVKVPEPDGREFKEGAVYELPLTSCDRWIRRKVAKYAQQEQADQQEKETKQKSKKVNVDIDQ